MPDQTGTSTGVSGTLTDGTGVSAMTSSKVVKDLVFDFVVTALAALGAGAGADALDLGVIIGAPEAAGVAIAGALLRTLIRAVLRWSQS